MAWAYPVADLVVMDHLSEILDDSVWIGTWHPGEEHTGPVVIVTRGGHQTVDETRYAMAEIVVDAGTRGASRALAFDIADQLQELGGTVAGGVLVDEVLENSGPEPVQDVNDDARTESMVYTLAFRKHNYQDPQEG